MLILNHLYFSFFMHFVRKSLHQLLQICILVFNGGKILANTKLVAGKGFKRTVYKILKNYTVDSAELADT